MQISKVKDCFMRLLVVEDDAGLATGIGFYMEREGYEVIHAGTLRDAAKKLEEECPDVVLLDLNLPDGDGLDFCRNVRKTSQVPVIMLTARDMETDEVQGLLCGADDYLTKPFSLAVLKARLDTVMRRSRARNCMDPEEEAQETADRENQPELVGGGIRLLTGKMKVYCDGKEVDCSVTEYRLLQYLMENCGQVMLKEQILAHVWDNSGSFVDENTLQVAIRRLRRKLNDDGAQPGHIRTVRGMGYIFTG